jgi:hypothetical protein
MGARERRGWPSAARFAALGLGLGLVLSIACSPGAPPQDGSETHFLRSCAAGCPQAQACVCGVCTTVCASAADCEAYGAEASCVPVAPRIAELRCAATEPATRCDAECVEAEDCAWLGAGFACESGFCRSGMSPVPGEPGGKECEPSQVLAEDVVVLGDSLIELSTFTAEVERHALGAGLILPGAHYRSYASSLMSFLAEGPLSLGAQYSTARAERAARVVIMDGGATDMLNNPCAPAPTPGCPAVQAAVQGAERLFSRLAADGVEHVVYFFYGDAPGNPSLRAGLDTLRPLVQNVCGKSHVACHWLDLRPVFAGHAEYFGPDGIVFSDAGAQAAAASVFELMRTRCIAQ